MNTSQPTVFIGSSSEGIEIARAVRSRLESVAEATVWDEDLFELGKTTIESLAQMSGRFDFAVLVLSPDDFVESRGKEGRAPRDNVVFELGLFTGVLGRTRTVILRPEDPDLKLPTDLLGVTTASYRKRSDQNFVAAVGTACDKICRTIKADGRRVRAEPADNGLELNRVRERDGIISTVSDGCELRIVFGRLEEVQTDSTTAVVLPCNEYFDDHCASLLSKLAASSAVDRGGVLADQRLSS